MRMAYMSLGITVTYVVSYCHVNSVVMAIEVELDTRICMVKICFYHGNKEIHLLGCHFKVHRAHVWCVPFLGQHRTYIIGTLLP